MWVWTSARSDVGMAGIGTSRWRTLIWRWSGTKFWREDA